MELSNKRLLAKAGMDEDARLKWAIDNIYDIEKWGLSLKVIDNMTMFKKHKKNFPLMKRIGMNISDYLKIMSLAHIKLEK